MQTELQQIIKNLRQQVKDTEIQNARLLALNNTLNTRVEELEAQSKQQYQKTNVDKELVMQLSENNPGALRGNTGTASLKCLRTRTFLDLTFGFFTRTNAAKTMK